VIVAPAPLFALGIDTIAVLDAVRCQGLKSAGMSYALRYLGSLTSAERDLILASGLWLSVVTYGRTDWTGLGTDLGETDGSSDVDHLTVAGIPMGATVWIDLEGAPVNEATAITAWLNARSAALKAAGFDVGLYVGAGAGLTAAQLYALPNVDRYWRSLSNVPTPDAGYAMLQLYPDDQIVAGTQVDVNVTQTDWQGRRAMFVRP
jgi:hypothetical protein